MPLQPLPLFVKGNEGGGNTDIFSHKHVAFENGGKDPYMEESDNSHFWVGPIHTFCYGLMKIETWITKTPGVTRETHGFLAHKINARVLNVLQQKRWCSNMSQILQIIIN